MAHPALMERSVPLDFVLMAFAVTVPVRAPARLVFHLRRVGPMDVVKMFSMAKIPVMFVQTKMQHRAEPTAFATAAAVAESMRTEPCVRGLNVAAMTFMAIQLV